MRWMRRIQEEPGERQESAEPKGARRDPLGEGPDTRDTYEPEVSRRAARQVMKEVREGNK
jgi:hypothetical protein